MTVENQNKKHQRLKIDTVGNCWLCSCGQRQEIINCSCPDCTLWAVRPYKEKTHEQAR